MYPSINRARGRVLLIDDNVDGTYLMQRYLTILGFTVEVANTGRDGIELAKSFLPKVILLDLGIPQMSGYDVIAQLKHIPSLGDTFILALTGREDQQTRHRVLQAGFHRHLVKTADSRHIARILDEYF